MLAFHTEHFPYRNFRGAQARKSEAPAPNAAAPPVAAAASAAATAIPLLLAAAGGSAVTALAAWKHMSARKARELGAVREELDTVGQVLAHVSHENQGLHALAERKSSDDALKQRLRARILYLEEETRKMSDAERQLRDLQHQAQVSERKHLDQIRDLESQAQVSQRKHLDQIRDLESKTREDQSMIQEQQVQIQHMVDRMQNQAQESERKIRLLRHHIQSTPAQPLEQAQVTRFHELQRQAQRDQETIQRLNETVQHLQAKHATDLLALKEQGPVHQANHYTAAAELYQHELQQAQNLNDALRRELAAREDECSLLKAQIQTRTEEAHSAMHIWQNSQRDHDHLREQLNELQSQYEKLFMGKETLQRQYDATISHVEYMNAEREAAHAKDDQLLTDMRRIQTELDTSERTIQELKHAHDQEITQMRLDFMQNGQAMRAHEYARAEADFHQKWEAREREYQNQINLLYAELEQLKRRDAMQD